MPFFKNFAIILFLFACPFSSNSQEFISEDEITINILKWYYDQYPNGETISWSSSSVNNVDVLKVKFNYNENEYTATYSLKGKRLSETVKIENIPITVTNYLYDNYAKFKIKSFLKRIDFKANETSYEVEIKSKEAGLERIVFDTNFQRETNQVLTSN
ncbi:hypothetical protein [Ekhidna sp.]